MTNIEKIKLIVDLTIAKVDILKLKADPYNWHSFVDADTKRQLEKTLDDINDNIMIVASLP